MTLKVFGTKFADVVEALLNQVTSQDEFDQTPVVFQADGMYFGFTSMFTKDGIVYVNLTRRDE